MAISKLIFNGVIQMDLTSDTVTASVLNSGYTAHDAAGEAITGTGGGGGGSGNWMGQNATKIHTYTPEMVYLKDSPLASWTWSTSQTSLVSTEDYPTITVDDTHDYIMVFQMYVHYDYGNWTPVAAVSDWAITSISWLVRYPSTLANAQAETTNNLIPGSLTTDYRTYYYNINGALSYSSLQYGLYSNTALYAQVASGATTSTPSIRGRLPSIYARGNASYFSETAFQNLDMDSSYYKRTCEVWQVDAGTSAFGYLTGLTPHILNNGL